MAFNWKATESWYIVDQENKMMLTQPPSWVEPGKYGMGDAIGRTSTAFYVYRDNRFIKGIENCWEKVERKNWLGRILKGKYYYQGYRYPVRFENEIGLSRDHAINTILSFKHAGKTDKELWEFVKHTRFRISDFALQTIDMWLWSRVVSGRNFWKLLYYPTAWITAFMTANFQKIVQWFIKIGPDYEVHQDEFKYMQNKDKPAKVVRQCKYLYPTFALNLVSWRYYYLQDGWWKRQLQKQMLRIVPKYNYVIKLLLDDQNNPVTQEDIDGYKAMQFGRWGGNLNKWWNDRALEVITKPEYLIENVMDVDLLKKLWEEHENS